MRHGQCQRSGNGHRSVSQQAELIMDHGCAGKQQQQANRAAEYNSDASMAPEAERKGNDTDRYDDHQHLQVHMTIDELPGKRQRTDDKRQCQAMQQAKTG